MSAKAVFFPDAPRPPPFLSQALTFGNLVFCSGQVATDPKTSALIQGSITDRTVCDQPHRLSFHAHSIIDIQKQIMLNLSAVLDAADSSLDNILKVNIYLTNLKDFSEVNDAYVAFFPGLKPASTLESEQMGSRTLIVVETGKDLRWRRSASIGY